MATTVLIPARLASSRLPEKPLADVGGVPMVVRVAQRVRQALALDTQVVVACDSPRIVAACEAFGVQALLTRGDHVSGSDRLAEACQLLGLPDDEIVVNVQGDEPLIDTTLVAAVAALLNQYPQASMGTAAHAVDQSTDFYDPNVVKVVCDAAGMAMYFSRAPIAWWRDRPANAPTALPHPAPLRHIGIYSYRAGFLRNFPNLAQAPMEVTEALEQLRALWHGHKIAVYISAVVPGPGVDTPQDLERVRALFAKGSH
jgi:3-deoxy-manno-octulosonate cytidylyltransferase (CMP-KDO synthetase)